MYYIFAMVFHGFLADGFSPTSPRVTTKIERRAEARAAALRAAAGQLGDQLQGSPYVSGFFFSFNWYLN